MTSEEDARLDKEKKQPAASANERDNAAAWNDSRERLAKLSAQYEKAKAREKERTVRCATA